VVSILFLTRSFSSDAIEWMFSGVRWQGSSPDATDARAAHYAIKRIIQSGLITWLSSSLHRVVPRSDRSCLRAPHQIFDLFELFINKTR
jgi:hypothetical protein